MSDRQTPSYFNNSRDLTRRHRLDQGYNRINKPLKGIVELPSQITEYYDTALLYLLF